MWRVHLNIKIISESVVSGIILGVRLSLHWLIVIQMYVKLYLFRHCRDTRFLECGDESQERDQLLYHLCRTGSVRVIKYLQQEFQADINVMLTSKDIGWCYVPTYNTKYSY